MIKSYILLMALAAQEILSYLSSYKQQLDCQVRLQPQLLQAALLHKLLMGGRIAPSAFNILLDINMQHFKTIETSSIIERKSINFRDEAPRTQ